MSVKYIVGGILVFIAGAVIAGLIITSGEDTAEPVYEEDASYTAADPVTFSVEEIKSHNTAEDCWSVITGDVYDLTNYISTHPGADTILLACGADGTTLFASRTTDDGEIIGSGTQHSDTAFQILGEFYIGTVEPTP